MGVIDFLGLSGDNTLQDLKELLEKYRGADESHPFYKYVYKCLDRKKGTQIAAHCIIMAALKDEYSDFGFKDIINELPNTIDKTDKNKLIKRCLDTPIENELSHFYTTTTEYGIKEGWKDYDGSFNSALTGTLTKFPYPAGSKIYNNLTECLMNGDRQVIFTGAPGTGKTYGVRNYILEYLHVSDDGKKDVSEKTLSDYENEDRVKFVQFHSSYDYTDLVEGLRPAVIGHDSGNRPVTAFVRMDGEFKKFCRKVIAKGDPNSLYFFVIDEINRADLSRVFGELMFCLEKSYRGEKKTVTTQYDGLPVYEYKRGADEATKVENDVFSENGFYIPKNVVVIGTMNDIDRSVETFDYALRRRFRWIETDADSSIMYITASSRDAEDSDYYKRIERARKLNDVISSKEYSLGEAYKLGGTYFKGYTDMTRSEEYFNEDLLPILNEYMRGSAKNVRDGFIKECRNAFLETENSEGESPETTANGLGVEEALEKYIGSGDHQIIFTGAPGTGKTYGVREYVNKVCGDEIKSRSRFVQFHSSYDYTDFVEGLRPAVIGHDSENKPVTAFVRMDGEFKKFCREVIDKGDPDKLYFFVIDEINRADLSRVFGELMFCLEKSYRGKENVVTTQYSGLPAYEYKNGADVATQIKNENDVKNDGDVFKNHFYIPENVVIIGTMNDIDRSVETFDYALRRRFRWVKISAKTSIDGMKDTLQELKNRANALNEVIADEKYSLGEDFRLGRSYFQDYNGEGWETYFNSALKPILSEYMRGRPDSAEFLEECKQKFKEGSSGSDPR